jgi:hypothetical protein
MRNKKIINSNVFSFWIAPKINKRYSYLKNKIKASKILYSQGNLYGARTELTILYLFIKELERDINKQIKYINTNVKEI